MAKLFCADIRCEYQREPIGIDEKTPRFFWKVTGDYDKIKQAAYEININDVWSTGKVYSENSTHVPYGGKPLKPFTRYMISIRIWDGFGNCSDWAHSFFETGVMSSQNFLGNWLKNPDFSSESTIFRHAFTVADDIDEARLYITALGVYEAELNGIRISDIWLAPGFTTYNKNLQYQTYDVTGLIKDKNALCITVANGWFNGRISKKAHINAEVKQGILAMLRVKTRDGKISVFSTGEGWKCRQSAYLLSDMYDGETYDAASDSKACRFYEFDDSKWADAIVLNLSKSNLMYQNNEPVRIKETVTPISLITTPKGEKVIDFGQNMVGWAEFKVKGKRGDRVVLSHSEILDHEGNFYTENLRSAKSKVTYILSGEGEEIFHPRFCFQGFRYIRIDEYPGDIKLNDFRGLVIYSDLERTGYFECSDDNINKLYQNTIWSQKGNYVDIPTDCPQRDERLGWTGDAQVFVKAACLNMNVALFFAKWLRDVSAEQKNMNGAVPNIVPSLIHSGVSAAWGDAATICPTEIYYAFGDERLLKRQYESMKSWVEYIKSCCIDDEYHWNTGKHFGDWLGLDAQEGSYRGATDQYLIATAFYAYSAKLVSDAAEILGYDEDKVFFRNLSQKVADKYKKIYLTNGAIPKILTQTACALTIHFGLTDDKAKTASALVALLEQSNNHLTTGFVGTPYLIYALSDNGYEDIAYNLLFQTEYPSWLYPILMGATTIWEHWDGIREDGSMWDASMNSFNHYAYGAVVDWMYTRIAGINYIKQHPGYKKSLIKPLLTDKLTYAAASIETLYGTLSCRWERNKDGKYIYHIVIPNNTESEFVFPDGRKVALTSGSYILE